MEYKKISFAQAKEILDTKADAILLDVREEAEYITGHAVDAVLLPLDEITVETAFDAIPDYETPVLVYCRSGRRSREAVMKLLDYGYSEVYDLGGLIGWPYGME